MKIIRNICLALLVSSNLFAAQVRDQNQLNADLWLAIENVYYEQGIGAVEALLKRGADPNMTLLNGNSLLQYVITSNKHSTLVDLLLSYGADVDHVNNEGKTATMFAIEFFRPQHLHFLMKYGPDLEIQDNHNLTAADYLAEWQQQSPVRYKELKRMMGD